jgi:DNA-binding HxlR family transcriptional regulator
MTSTRDTRQELLYQSMLDILANKWSLPVIFALDGGPERFGELQQNLRGVNPKVLTRTLRILQEFGIVERVVHLVVPLHVEYSLTELGHSSTMPLQAILTWLENCRPVPQPRSGVAAMKS